MQYILTLIFWHLSSKKQKVAQDPDGVEGSGKGAVLEALASYKSGLVWSPGIDAMGSIVVKRLGYFFLGCFSHSHPRRRQAREAQREKERQGASATDKKQRRHFLYKKSVLHVQSCFFAN